MLTVAYCRVSTQEQAAEGFSIEGQADRLRAYAEFNELGDVMVVTDPGLSGKNLDRPGLQKVLGMVADGHVDHVLVWRLDRLSRDLGDLLLLADTFGNANVALHSFSEKIDLSSATGRMFYSVLGAFAQFYREQLSENVRMGSAQAVREGKWINRPKTGYDLVEGELVPNGMAPIIRQIFRLRADGASLGDLERSTGVGYSTVRTILHSRIYLGEVLHNGNWFPGKHEAIISPEEFAAAHRGRTPGRRQGRDLLSGRVRCGECGRAMSVEDNGSGHIHFRCRHRGSGCALPRRSTRGLTRAAVLGLRLIGSDPAIKVAIRRENALHRLRTEQRKLLQLHYAGEISSALFADEERRLATQIDLLASAESARELELQRATTLADEFDRVVAYLETIDIESLWEIANETERRTLFNELLDQIVVHEDHLVVKVHGALPLNVTLEESGLVKPGEFPACRRGDLNPHVLTDTRPST